MRFFIIFVSVSVFLLLIYCQPKTTRIMLGRYPMIKALPDSVTITVSQENVRQTPNGKIIGILRKDQKVKPYKKVVNWIKFYSQKFDSAYVWAPSVGFDYINLYNPHTYYDITAKEFYPIEYFQKLTGNKGVRRQQLSGEYELFFSELGLGSHEDIIVEVVKESTEKVKHGITFFVHEKTDQIYQVKVDFFKPVQGIEAAIKKCGLKEKIPTETNQGHVLWKKDSLISGLAVDLERLEWESNWFSSIWFKLEK